MRPSVDKKTQQYLDSLAQTTEEEPDFSYQNLDALDKLIFEEGVRIDRIYLEKDLDVMLILLNNKKVITRRISDFRRLVNATQEQLNQFESDGIGIHWPELDEDLSLKGFLMHELSRSYLSKANH